MIIVELCSVVKTHPDNPDLQSAPVDRRLGERPPGIDNSDLILRCLGGTQAIARVGRGLIWGYSPAEHIEPQNHWGRALRTMIETTGQFKKKYMDRLLAVYIRVPQSTLPSSRLFSCSDRQHFSLKPWDRCDERGGHPSRLRTFNGFFSFSSGESFL